MNKQITYFDPRVIENDPNGQTITITVNTQDEYDAAMAAITNPERGIPQDSIVIEDAPPTADELKEQLAATDYKIVKCMEYQLAGLPAPYGIQALHAERQALRDAINAAG